MATHKAGRELSASDRRRQAGRVLMAAGVLVLLGWAVVTAARVAERGASLQAHVRALSALVDEPGVTALDEAGAHLTGMKQDLDALQAAAGPLLPASRLLSWIPRYGADLAAIPDLLAAAHGVVSAGDRTYRALAPALAPLTGSGDPNRQAGEEMLPVLVAAEPELRLAQGELAAARAARGRMDATRLSPRVAGLLQDLDRYTPWLETAVDGALIAPSLLGAAEARTYLIIAQNNQELRPTGGLISGVGELRVDQGRLDSLRFEDSYAVDNLKVPHEIAPPDFQQTLYGQMILLRDANWHPDFATSAWRVLDIYARDRGVAADGVIALDLDALARLVKAVEPLQVEGIDVPVTGDNVLPAIQQAWGEPAGGTGLEWWQHRKDFMGDIAAALVRRLLDGQDVDPVALARALKKALDEKQVLIYVNDTDALTLLRQRNWDGRLRTADEPGDFLMVVDSNVGFNKVDSAIEREIDYRVDLSKPEAPVARVQVRYRHLVQRPVGACVQEARYGEGYGDLIERCYWDYVRVVVPAGSTLVQGPSIPLPAGSLLARNAPGLLPAPVSPAVDLGGVPAWTAFFVLPSAEEVTLAWDYRLPPSVVRRSADGALVYHLLVQKQPGTEPVLLHVELVLPAGARVVSASPATGPGIKTDLQLDRQIEIVLDLERERP